MHRPYTTGLYQGYHRVIRELSHGYQGYQRVIRAITGLSEDYQGYQGYSTVYLGVGGNNLGSLFSDPSLSPSSVDNEFDNFNDLEVVFDTFDVFGGKIQSIIQVK